MRAAGRTPAPAFECLRVLPVLGRSSWRLRAADGEVFEARVLANEGELHDAGGAVALLGDDQFRHALVVCRGLRLVAVHVLTVDEDDDVGVLLEGAGLPQVGELRPVIRSRLGCATELR